MGIAMNRAIAIAVALGLAVAAVLAQDKPVLQFAATTASTQSALGNPTTQSVQQLRREIDRLRAKSASAGKALDRARAAALPRLAQTPEYQRDQAAIAEAQRTC
jgi:uncharacterized protein HemX